MSMPVLKFYKFYVSEQELKEIFKNQFDCGWGIEDFYEWVDRKAEVREVEHTELDYYEVSKLDYKPKMSLEIGFKCTILNIIVKASKVLRESGKEYKRKEMFERIKNTKVNSIDEILSIVLDYVEVE